jgi:hypothetical protein
VRESQRRQAEDYLYYGPPSSLFPPSSAPAQAQTSAVDHQRRCSAPFSPSCSSATTSPSEYTPSEVSKCDRKPCFWTESYLYMSQHIRSFKGHDLFNGLKTYFKINTSVLPRASLQEVAFYDQFQSLALKYPIVNKQMMAKY